MIFITYDYQGNRNEKPSVGNEYAGYLNCPNCLASMIKCTAENYIGKKYPARVSYLCGAVVLPDMGEKPFKPNEKFSWEKECKNIKLWNDVDIENYNKVMECFNLSLTFKPIDFSEEEIRSYILIRKILCVQSRFFGKDREIDYPLYQKVCAKVVEKYRGPRGGLTAKNIKKAENEAYEEWGRFVWAHKNFRPDLVDKFLLEYN